MKNLASSKIIYKISLIIMLVMSLSSLGAQPTSETGVKESNQLEYRFIRWRLEPSGKVFSPYYDESTLYFPIKLNLTAENRHPKPNTILAISTATGKPIWAAQTERPYISIISRKGKNLYLHGSGTFGSPNLLMALDAQIGEKRWTIDSPDPPDEDGIGSNYVVHIAGGPHYRSTPIRFQKKITEDDRRTKLICRDAETGQELWRLFFDTLGISEYTQKNSGVETEIFDYAVVDTVVLVSTKDYFLAIDAKNGTEILRQEQDHDIPAITTEDVNDGRVTILDSLANQLTGLDLKSPINKGFECGNLLILELQTGEIVALGQVTEADDKTQIIPIHSAEGILKDFVESPRPPRVNPDIMEAPKDVRLAKGFYFDWGTSQTCSEGCGGSRTAFSVGLFMKYYLKKRLAIQPEVSFTTRGDKDILVFASTGEPTGDTSEERLTYTNVQFLAMLGGSAHARLRFRLLAGLYVGINHSAKYIIHRNDGATEEHDLPAKTDLGYILGLGFEYGGFATKGPLITLDFRFIIGLKSIVEEGTEVSDVTFSDAKNYAVMLRLGVGF